MCCWRVILEHSAAVSIVQYSPIRFGLNTVKPKPFDTKKCPGKVDAVAERTPTPAPALRPRTSVFLRTRTVALGLMAYNLISAAIATSNFSRWRQSAPAGVAHAHPHQQVKPPLAPPQMNLKRRRASDLAVLLWSPACTH